MQLINLFRNYVNALTGSRQEFDQLLDAGDISGALGKMTNRASVAMDALEEYEADGHSVTKRRDKMITDKNGNFIRMEKVWKLPIPYQRYINEMAIVFLYGRPVKWVNVSDGADKAFSKFQQVIKDTRFDAKVRQFKRIAGAETESAMLFRTFRNEAGEADLQIRVLAHSKGDDMFTLFDQYENLTAFAWGYNVRGEKDDTEYHVDIFTRDTVRHCTKRAVGWDVETETNFAGKIPVIYVSQDKEWAGVENLIEREEYIASRTADTNDYFSDPIAIMNADVIRNMPEKKEAAKILVTNDREGVDKAAKYLTWDSAPESKRQEIEWLQERILAMSFTPNISIDTLKSMSNMSAKAIRTVMMLADIKASRRMEQHDELLSRTSSLIASIIGNVLDVSLKGECERLRIWHEFQEPFGDDVEASIGNIVRSVEAGILSVDGGIELNPLVKDATRERERINAEAEERSRAQEEALNLERGLLSFGVAQ